MRRPFQLLILGALALAMVAGTGSAAPKTKKETLSYTGNGSNAQVTFAPGGTVFKPPAGATLVTLKLSDNLASALGMPTKATACQNGPAGDFCGGANRAFCNQTSTPIVIDPAKELQVLVHSADTCGPSPAIGSAGMVTATFTITGALKPKIPTGAREVGARKITWTAPLPLNTLTPYNNALIPQQQQKQAACDKTPYSIQGATGEQSIDEVARIPAPSGSWADVVVKVPAKVAGLVPVGLAVRMKPTLDWDLFVCKVVKGKYVYAGDNVNSAGGTSGCTDPAGIFGCTESVKVSAKPGETFVLRAWNWFDVNPTLQGVLSFLGARR